MGAGDTIVRKTTIRPTIKVTPATTTQPRKKKRRRRTNATTTTTPLATSTLTTIQSGTSNITNGSGGTTETFYVSVEETTSFDHQRTLSIGTGTLVLACGCSALIAVVLCAAFYLILLKYRKKEVGWNALGLSTRSTNNTTSTDGTSKKSKTGSAPLKKQKLFQNFKTFDEPAPKVALKVGDDFQAELPSVMNRSGDLVSSEDDHKKTLIEKAGRPKNAAKSHPGVVAAPKLTKKTGEKLSLPGKLSIAAKKLAAGAKEASKKVAKK